MRGAGWTAYAVICFMGVVNASPYDLKHSYDILKNEHKDLALLHGAVAFETGAVRRMYDHGALGYHGDRIPLKTVKLVHKLFNRPPGSVGDSGFLVTKAVRELPDDQVAEFVASTVVFLRRLPQEDFFRRYAIKNNALKKAEAEKPGDKSTKKLAKEVAEARRSLLTAFDCSSDHPVYEPPLKKLTHYPIKAFLECATQKYMPMCMPSIILQAMLYKKTGGSRAAQRVYYTLLDKHLDCLAKPLPASWELDAFSPEQRNELLAELKKTPLTHETVHRDYERYAFVNISPTNYPPIATYSDATIKGAEFTDCMDTTLRNLTNLLAYNPATGKFEASLLEQRLGVAVHSCLKDFYGNYADPASVSDKKVHSYWAEHVSSHIPNAVYCRALPPLAHAKKDCVKVAQKTGAVATFLAKKGYVAVPDTSEVYDLRPSIKNFIIACDYLLGLCLFNDAAPDAWAHEGFVTTYLPKLAQALKAKLPTTLDLDTIERYDVTTASLEVPLAFAFEQGGKPYGFSATVHTDYDDGELIFAGNSGALSGISVPDTLTAQSPASLVFLQPTAAMQHGETSGQILAGLFAHDIDDPSKLFALVQQPRVFDEPLLNQLLFCAREHKELEKQRVLTCRVYQEALQRGMSSKDAVVRDAIVVARDAIKSPFPSAHGEGVRLFAILFAHGKGVDEARTFANELMRAGDKHSISAALMVFGGLVEHDTAFDDAIQAAQEGLRLERVKTSDRGAVHFEATRLYRHILTHLATLVREGKEMDRAQTVAQSALACDVEAVCSAAQELLAALAAQKKQLRLSSRL